MGCLYSINRNANYKCRIFHFFPISINRFVFEFLFNELIHQSGLLTLTIPRDILCDAFIVIVNHRSVSLLYIATHRQENILQHSNMGW